MPKGERLAIACIAIVVSSLLLFYQLDAKSLWVDELHSARMSEGDIGTVILNASHDLHPPLYFLLLNLWTMIAGDSDFALRFPSLICGLLSLPLMYRIGARTADTRWGMLSMWLLGTSPFFVLFSRTARYYSLAMLLGLASCLLLLEFTERGRRATLLLYIVVSISALYASYLTGSLLAAQAVYLVLQRRQYGSRFRGWLLAQFVMLLLLSPWVATVLQQMARAGQGPEADFARGLSSYILKLGYPLYSFSLGETSFPWHPLAGAGMLVFVCLLLLGSRHLKKQRRLAMLLFVVVPILATAVVVTDVSTSTTFINVPSRTMFAAPFFYLIAAGGLLWIRHKRLRTVILLVIVLAWGYALRNYYTNRYFHNPVYVIPAREIAVQVAEAAQPGDVVVSDWDSGFGHYYAKTDRGTTHFFSQSSAEAQRLIETQGTRRVWLITLGRDSTRSMDPAAFIRWLDQNYLLTVTWGYAEQDEMYRRAKGMLLHRPAYRYKATVQLYERR